MSYTYQKNRSGLVKRFATRFINLTSAFVIAVTGLVGAAPLFVTGTAHAVSPQTIFSEPATKTISTTQHDSHNHEWTSAGIDVSGYYNLKMSFDFDISALESGESISYGWQVGGHSALLGSIGGTGNHDAGSASKSLNLAVYQGATDLKLWISNDGTSSTTSDDITVSNIELTGKPDTNITLVSPADGATINKTQTFSWNAADDASSYRLDISTNSSFPSNSSTKSINSSGASTTIPGSIANDLNPGTTYYWRVFPCGDYFCHKQFVSATRSFTVDTTPPQLNNLLPASNSTVNSSDQLNLSVDATDNVAVSSVKFTLSSNNGNGETWSIDTGNSGSFGLSSDPSASVYVKQVMESVGGYAGLGLSSGDTFDLTAEATDTAGNTKTLTSTNLTYIDNTLSRDTTGPTITVNAGSPSNGDYLSGVRWTRHDQPDQQRNRFIFNITDPSGVQKGYINLHNMATGKKYHYSLTQHVSPHENQWYADVDTTKLPDGVYQIEARAVDNANNAKYFNNRLNSYGVTIDNATPTITVKDNYVGSKAENTFSNVSFKLHDNTKVDWIDINGYHLELSDNSWSDANYNAIKGHLHQGANNTITLYDVAGNTSSYTFTYDTVAPTFALTDDGNPRAPITDGSTVNPTKLGDVDGNGSSIRFTKESTTDTLYVNGQPIFGHGYFNKGKSGQIGAAFKNDGTYTLYTKDLAGNQSAPITFTVDTVAPAAPAIKTPIARQWFRGTPIIDSWSKVTTDTNGNPETVDHYQIAYNYDDGHTFGGTSTCPSLSIVGIAGFIGCRDVNNISRNHSPHSNEQGGVTIWVRAVDQAGNASAWSKSVHYYYDHEAPTTTLHAPTGVTGGGFTVSGHATDNLSLNRVYVQLVSRVTNQRCGGTTINLIGKGTAADWSKNYDISTLGSGCPDGQYAAHVTVVDMAGNTSSEGWTDNFTVDSAAPTAIITSPAKGDVVGGDTLTIKGTATDATSFVNYRYYVKDSTGKVVGNPGWSKVGTSQVSNGVLGTWDIKGLPSGIYTVGMDVYDGVTHTWAGHTFVIDHTAPTVLFGTHDGAVQKNLKIDVTLSDNHKLSQYGFDVTGPNGVHFSTANYQTNETTVQLTGFDLCANAHYGTCPTDLPDGTYTVRAKAYDAYSNRNISKSITIVVDNTAPVVAVTPAPGNGYLTGTEPFTITVTDDNLDASQLNDVYVHIYKPGSSNSNEKYGEHIKFNKVSDTEYSGTFTVNTKNLNDGTYWFNVENITDLSGNGVVSKGEVHFHPYTIDNTEPDVPTLASPSNGSVLNNSQQNPDFDLVWDSVSNPNGVTYDWQSSHTNDVNVTNGGFNDVLAHQDGLTDTSLSEGRSPEGTYYWQVRACDGAGNCSNWSAPWKFTVDNTAPNVTIDSFGWNGNVVQPTISVDGNTAPTSGYTYSWDNNAGVTVSNSSALNPTFTVDTDGTYTFNLTVTDDAGNTTTVPFSFTYTTPQPSLVSTTHPSFTEVTTSTQTNDGNGTTTPITPLSNNGNGTNAPQVLGTQTNTPNDNSDSKTGVKGDKTTKELATNASNKDAASGWSWWWLLPILIVLIALIWFLLAARKSQNDDKS